MTGVEIAGLGHYAPDRIVTNAEIEARLGLEAGWIKPRTGIEERRYVADDEALSDIAVKAGDMALERAGTDRADIALLILATSTPDHLLPPSAPLVGHRLGLANAGGIDTAGACAGFVYALTLADGFVRTQRQPALVIAANVLSRRTNLLDRNSSVLFADAAGAVVLQPTERSDAGLIGSKLAAQGAHYDLITIPGGGSRKPFAALANAAETLMIIADGPGVYQRAVAMMTDVAVDALQRAGLTPSDVAHFIPHQANARMTTTLASKLGIDQQRMLSTIAKFGNSSAATIPFTLSACAPHREIHKGDIVLMTAAGAGLSGGACVWRW